MKLKFSLLVFSFAFLPASAFANYLCDCYVDLRYIGQGLVWKGQANSPSVDSGKYYCTSAYRETSVASCKRESSGSYQAPAPIVIETPKEKKDCINAPVGIADACIEAFQPEYNPNPGQTEIVRSGCITSAISVGVVKSCLKKFPLNSTKNEEATYLRSDCIRKLSVDSFNQVFRCPM